MLLFECHSNAFHSAPLVPCVPTNVTARRTCGNSTVEVSWKASRGTQSYVAFAVGDDGHRTKCTSNTTTCSIPDLHCSSVYSISLVAVNGNCSSRESQSVTLHTGEAIWVVISDLQSNFSFGSVLLLLPETKTIESCFVN